MKFGIFLPGLLQVFIKDGSFGNFYGWWNIRESLNYPYQSSGFKVIFWFDGQFPRWSYVYGGSEVRSSSKVFYLQYVFENVY